MRRQASAREGPNLTMIIGPLLVVAGVLMIGTDAGAQGSRVGTATTPGTAPTAGGASSALARFDVRLTALEEELRATTGRVEDLTFQIQRMSERLDTALSDIEMRLGRLDGATAPPAASAGAATGAASAGAAGAAATPSQDLAARTPPPQAEPTAPPSDATSPPASPPAGPSNGASTSPSTGALPEGSPEEQYAYAFGLLRQAKYPEAEVAFSAFLDEYPDDALANNAGYWLGETYYVRKDYVKAAEAFLNAYQKQKTGPKAPDALLKLAMSLGQLDKKSEACTTLGEMKRAFPEAPERVTGKARDEGRRLGCQ